MSSHLGESYPLTINPMPMRVKASIATAGKQDLLQSHFRKLFLNFKPGLSAQRNAAVAANALLSKTVPSPPITEGEMSAKRQPKADPDKLTPYV